MAWPSHPTSLLDWPGFARPLFYPVEQNRRRSCKICICGL